MDVPWTVNTTYIEKRKDWKRQQELKGVSIIEKRRKNDSRYNESKPLLYTSMSLTFRRKYTPVQVNIQQKTNGCTLNCKHNIEKRKDWKRQQQFKGVSIIEKRRKTQFIDNESKRLLNRIIHWQSISWSKFYYRYVLLEKKK